MKTKKPKENKTLFYSGIAGIGLIIISVPTIALLVLEMLSGRDPNLMPAHLAINIFSLLFSILFIWGFKILAEKTKNNFLKNMAYLSLISTTIVYLLSILDLFYGFMENLFVAIPILVIGGIISILFGKGLLSLKKEFGNLATAAAILEIICGICSLTVILYFLNFILLFPLYILEAIILFKASEKF